VALDQDLRSLRFNLTPRVERDICLASNGQLISIRATFVGSGAWWDETSEPLSDQ